MTELYSRQDAADQKAARARDAEHERRLRHLATKCGFELISRRGKRCVLLYCGDHDPGGLNISAYLRSNLEELEGAVGWSPDKLIIERFGLNYDFIEKHHLTWIDNLITGAKSGPMKGVSLSNPKHNDHLKPYVQSYIRQFGVRKVEGEALVRVPAAGRKLCRKAILKYVNEDEIAPYHQRLAEAREEVRGAVLRLLEATRI